MFGIVTPGASFEPKGHHLNKLGKGPQRHANCQISKLFVCLFLRRRILKFSFFEPMFQSVAQEAGSVLTKGASYEQTWYRSTRRCFTPNIKALQFPFSKKKNCKVSFFVSMFKLVTPRVGPVLTPGASYEQTRGCFIPNIKALRLPLSEKKILEVFFSCSYLRTCDPGAGPVLT